MLFFRFSAGDWSRLPGRNFKSRLAVWDATGAWSSWGTENYCYISLLFPGWTRQASCRNWSHKLTWIPDMCDKVRWEKAVQVSEDVPQRCSCPACLSLGCIRWNAGEWNCFTDQKLSHKKQNGQIWFVGTREGVNGARPTSSFSPAGAFHGSLYQLLCSGMQSPNCAMCAISLLWSSYFKGKS